MNATELSIIEQFSLWSDAIGKTPAMRDANLTIYTGCGSSYNLALAMAAVCNRSGKAAIAVPGSELLHRAAWYAPRWKDANIVAISRSGESTETVAAAKAARVAGAHVIAVTVEKESSIAKNCDTLVYAPTHLREGIVMTASASLMLLMGIEMVGHTVAEAVPTAAQNLMKSLDAALPQHLFEKHHVVFLGGHALFGIALEGALKLMEMSQVVTQAFHPMEYRHGPISLVDDGTAVVVLYSTDQKSEEEKLVSELQSKGAFVIGLGGAGDISLDLHSDETSTGLEVMPALQILGERFAQARNVDTLAPRHLTKVVTLT